MVELRGVGFAWALCGIGAVALAGCGGGGGGGGGGSGATNTPTPLAASSKAVTVFLPAGATVTTAPSAILMPGGTGAAAINGNTFSVTGGLPNGAGSYTQNFPTGCTTTSTDLSCSNATDALSLSKQAGSKAHLPIRHMVWLPVTSPAVA
jgi:hypothetical protein